MAEAEKQTGFSDWGDEEFRKGFRILLKSLQTEANLSLLGKLIIKKNLARLLANRLRIQNDFTQHSEIRKESINKPLFIIGLPRTGTTLLYNLLARDPGARTPLLWELFQPSPPPEENTRESDPRIEMVRKRYQQMDRLVPQMRAIHNMNPTEPEECVMLFQNIFASHIFSWAYDVPSYTRWILQHDMVPAYRYYKSILQLLQWRTPGEHWSLKSPHHLFHLDALLTVFPDACFIQTHRHPEKAVGSFCSLVTTMRRVNSKRADQAYIGKTQLEGLATGTERGMDAREKANPAQFYDLQYQDLIADPKGQVRKIYNYFGYPINEKMEAGMENWLTNNRQHKHGKHTYTLEQFGLSSNAIERRFSRYMDAFGIE